jgi:hypothetical protein
VPTKPHQTNPIRKPLADTHSTRRPKPNNSTKDPAEKKKSKEEALRKVLETRWEVCGKEVENVCPPFNFEHEMDNIKIFVPFIELIRKGEY